MSSSKKIKNNNIYFIIIIGILVVLGILLYFLFKREKYEFSNPKAQQTYDFLAKKNWIKQSDLHRVMLSETPNPTSIPLVPKPPPPKPVLPRAPEYQCPGGVCPGLGKGFDLTKVNLSNPSELLNGTDLFLKVNFSNNCQKYRPGGKTEKDIITTNSAQELITSIAINNSLTGSIPVQFLSLKPTIVFNTKSDLSKYQNIKSSHIVYSKESGVISFENNDKCRTLNINPKFMTDFKKLPVEVANYQLSTSWEPFRAFFNRWGTHVMTQITFGSKIDLWNTENKENSESSSQLEAKLCAQLDGPIPDATSPLASVCSKFDRAKREEALKTSTKETNIYIGGTEKTRDAFIESGNTRQNITDFIKSSSESNQAISYGFTPIWEVFQQIENTGCIETINKGEDKSIHCENLQRCLNLEAAYGFEASLCEKKVTSDGIVYQEFIKEDSGALKSYKCFNKKEGCNKNSDCHFKLGTGCRSYGPSALDKGEPVGNDFRTGIRGIGSGTAKEGINHSCYYNAFPAECRCDDKWVGGLNDRYIWDQAKE